MGTDNRQSASLSGLTEKEAKEFHSLFVASFIGYTVIAVVAHFLVGSWRPWLPSAAWLLRCTEAKLDSVHTALGAVMPFVA